MALKGILQHCCVNVKAGEMVMLSKRVGDPCPACQTALMRRRSTFRSIVGDVAYCARCNSSFELAQEEDDVLALAPDVEFAPI